MGMFSTSFGSKWAAVVKYWAAFQFYSRRIVSSIKVYVPDIGNASVSNCMNPDKLIEWLSLSADVSPERHTELSREVRQSLGMRIRKAT